VAYFPRPISRTPETKEKADAISAGRELFECLGCASCHQPRLGDVNGIYSDLLLHDMGPALSGAGSYAAEVQSRLPQTEIEPLPIIRDSIDGTAKENRERFGAEPREWRTPPLWGLHDSAPYLHDGRAQTIGEAILSHDGEGAAAAQAFEKLTVQEKSQLDSFLNSLVAPPMPW
jgi:CxxC motif-containing protein (DUF1111 family)